MTLCPHCLRPLVTWNGERANRVCGTLRPGTRGAGRGGGELGCEEGSVWASSSIDLFDLSELCVSVSDGGGRGGHLPVLLS